MRPDAPYYYIKNFLDPLRRGSKITSLRKDVVSRLNLSLLRMYPLFNALFFAFVLFTTLPAFSDTGGWAATYGGAKDDHANIQQTRDGGYIMAGETESFGAGKKDVWVLKLRADGTIDWQKTYGGNYMDMAGIVQQTSDGGYIVPDVTASFGAGDYDSWVLKLRADGAVEWQKTYGGASSDWASSTQETSNGGYIVAGRTESFGAGETDIWVLKLRPDGSINPACGFISDTTTSGEDSGATAITTDVCPINTDANPKDSQAVVRDTEVSANFICP